MERLRPRAVVNPQPVINEVGKPGKTSRKPSLLLGIGGLGLTALIALSGCRNTSEQEIPNPTPTPETVTSTPTPLSTPEFTPAPAFESLPQVPDELKTSWQSILDYWTTLKVAEHRLRLVENEKVRIDVVRTGSGEVQVSNGLSVIIENPQSADVAREIKSEITEQICNAITPVVPKDIQWGIAVPNAGADPFGEIGFTLGERQKFQTETNCPVPTQ